MITFRILGNSNFTVEGGDGSTGGGGGGAGGRVALNFLGNYIEDFSKFGTYGWSGVINLEGGSAGSENSNQSSAAEG